MTVQTQAIVAIVLFLTAYGLIISRKIHESVVALAAAALLVALGILNQQQALASVDFNTLGLLIGMMIIVEISRHSGMYEFVAVQSVRLARGNPLLLLFVLSLITALISAFLDNVTTVLLMAPVTLALAADTLGLSPIPFLFAEIMASNIGGAATLIGDLPNIIIGSASGLGFTEFMSNLAPVVIVIMLITAACFVLIWSREFHISEELRQKATRLLPYDQIRDWNLLYKSLLVMGLTIAGFFMQRQLHLESATIAIIGALLLLIATRSSMEEVLLNIDWPTILFLLGFFVIVGGLRQVGILNELATTALRLTGGGPSEITLVVLWFSAITSSFVNNTPFVTAMIPVIKGIGAATGQPLRPLWWALALGGCLGGNGTVLGASSNIVVSGIAERSGFRFTFWEYARVAFPLMVLSIVISSGFLLLFYK